MSKQHDTEMVRMNIYVPKQVRDLMRNWDAYASWSKVATKAFLGEILHLQDLRKIDLAYPGEPPCLVPEKEKEDVPPPTKK